MAINRTVIVIVIGTTPSLLRGRGRGLGLGLCIISLPDRFGHFYYGVHFRTKRKRVTFCPYAVGLV